MKLFHGHAVPHACAHTHTHTRFTFDVCHAIDLFSPLHDLTVVACTIRFSSNGAASGSLQRLSSPSMRIEFASAATPVIMTRIVAAWFTIANPAGCESIRFRWPSYGLSKSICAGVGSSPGACRHACVGCISHCHGLPFACCLLRCTPRALRSHMSHCSNPPG